MRTRLVFAASLALLTATSFGASSGASSGAAAQGGTLMGETLVGEWGGEGLVATFTAQGATFEAGCAQGAVASPVRPDAVGRFTAGGRFEIEHPGPQSADEDGRGVEAVYSGRVSGDALTLSIRPGGGGAPQTYHLRRGVRPKLVRCL